MKRKEQYLAMIFQQGGTLRNVCLAESKEQVENFMTVSYDFPFYAQYLPLDKLKNVADMITILNGEDAIRTNLTDVGIDLKVVGDFKAEDIIHHVTIDDDEVENGYGKKIAFDMNMFTEWKELNECPDCNGSGKTEEMNCHDQSNECCGGCFKDVECVSCEGAGKININL